MASHAILAASTSKRWMNCPGSIRLGKDAPRRPSSMYALMGTAAHEVLENCLNGERSLEEWTGRTVTVTDDFGKKFKFEVDGNMADALEVALEFFDKKRAEFPGADFHAERRVKLEWIQKGMFGTCDATLDAEDLWGFLGIYDYKHGSGVVVEVEDNSQALYYALGACGKNGWQKYDEIEIGIVQPRAPHADGPIRTQKVDPAYMGEFAKELASAAKAATAPNAPLKAGDWCKFCPAAATCPEIRAEAQRTAGADFDDWPGEDEVLEVPNEFEDLARALAWVPIVETWAKSVSARALQEALQGNKIPGKKAVRKRARSRVWIEPEADIARKLAAAGIEEGIWTEPSLRTPPQIEKLGKAAKKAVAGLAHMPEGVGYSLVNENDKRDEVKSAAAEDFADATDED